MFHLPAGTQRVRREDLESPLTSPPSSPDPALQEFLRAKIYTDFTFATPTTDLDIADIVQDAPPSDDDDEAELRLFAAPLNAPPVTHKIRLSSPGAQVGEPSILIKKPRSYYFAHEPTSDEEAAFQAAAISGETVVELSREPWPGCALPWKVHTISAAGMKREVLVGHPPSLVTVEDKAHKRTRKNKKTRIAIRKKLQARKEKQSEREKLAQEREEAEREKRTRRNREKKLKKKARDQAKKAAGGAGSGDENPADSAANQDSQAED
ncbi:hypothetical protein J1614_000257 [Plenodomus biglobosus]|nr:hypothetical protein J1614_000257 [Plenodomus biglobosus]